MSYIRANEFTLQSETVAFIFQHAPQMGYSDEEIEEKLASFERSFLREMLEVAKEQHADSVVVNDLDSFIHGRAYGYNTRFCLLRYGRG